MSRLNLKTDFKDGDKLFGIELNNNFKVIEEGYDGTTKEYEDIVADVKARKWQGASNESVAYFKGTTSEVNARQKIKGQVLYDISTGETFLDVSDSVRINTGSGNVVEISETEPENDATKLWIDGLLADGVMTEVVDSMENPSSNMAPSVNAAKEYIDKKQTYSTDEIVIGTWIDGKPVYRKVVIGKTPTLSENWTNALTFSNIDKIVKFNCLLNETSTSFAPIPKYDGSLYWIDVSIVNQKLRFLGSDSYSNKDYILIIEYTKTTD